MNRGEGSWPVRARIFMREISAEKSAISKRVEYLQNTVRRGDRNLEHFILLS